MIDIDITIPIHDLGVLEDQKIECFNELKKIYDKGIKKLFVDNPDIQSVYIAGQFDCCDVFFDLDEVYVTDWEENENVDQFFKEWSEKLGKWEQEFFRHVYPDDYWGVQIERAKALDSK